jgi:hypothetical protein
MCNKLQALLEELDSLDQDYAIERWQLTVHTYLLHRHSSEIASTFKTLADSNNVWDNSAKQKGYLESLVEKNSHKNEKIISVAPDDIHDLIKKLVNKTSKAIQPLMTRRKNSSVIKFDNEYDYQDFLHSMLIPWVRDIRTEEYTPKYVGTNKRVDFLLKDHKIFIEVKYARDKSHAKKLGDELAIDIHHYRSHTECLFLVAVIFDPNRHIVNPDGFAVDLSKKYSSGNKEIDVKVYVNS